MPKLFKSIFGQVVIALVVGVALGILMPSFAVGLKPLGVGFIKLIKVLIAPIVFCVVVHGIASAGSGLILEANPAASRFFRNRAFRLFPAAIAVVTLLARPAEADVLAIADSGANVRLILRNPLDEDTKGRSQVSLGAVMRATSTVSSGGVAGGVWLSCPSGEIVAREQVIKRHSCKGPYKGVYTG